MIYTPMLHSSYRQNARSYPYTLALENELPAFFNPSPRKVQVGDYLPTVECAGDTYYMSISMAKDFRVIRCFFPSSKITICEGYWVLPSKAGPHGYKIVPINKNKCFIQFALVIEPDEYSFIAWRFPIKHLQFHIRLFLARRRKSRRLALAMALHPRLGAGSPVHAWLNGDTLSKIYSMI